MPLPFTSEPTRMALYTKADYKHFLFFGNLLGGTAGRGGLHRRAGNNPPLSVMQDVREKIGVY